MFELANSLATCRTKDLRVLMEIAGGDPSTFYRGVALRGVDVCGQDLRGIDFSGADFAGVIADSRTKIDDSFDNSLLEKGLEHLQEAFERLSRRRTTHKAAIETAVEITLLAIDRGIENLTSEYLSRIARLKFRSGIDLARLVPAAHGTHFELLLSFIENAVREQHYPTARTMYSLVERGELPESAQASVIDWLGNNTSLVLNKRKRTFLTVDDFARVLVRATSSAVAGMKNFPDLLEYIYNHDEESNLARRLWRTHPLPARLEQFLAVASGNLSFPPAVDLVLDAAAHATTLTSARSFAENWHRFMTSRVRNHEFRGNLEPLIKVFDLLVSSPAAKHVTAVEAFSVDLAALLLEDDNPHKAREVRQRVAKYLDQPRLLRESRLRESRSRMKDVGHS